MRSVNKPLSFHKQNPAFHVIAIDYQFKQVLRINQETTDT